jgi:uncharacterized membrane protein YdjX (TVP38/TMEM64 family)
VTDTVAHPSTSRAVVASRWARRIVLALLVCAIVVAAVWLFATPKGQRLIHEPDVVGREFHAWVDDHPVTAPLLYVGIYVLASLLALPVSWLQILGGYAFGLPWAIVHTQIGATIGSSLTVRLSHWLAADWFQKKVESRLNRLREIDEKMGHNGFAVVMLVRLTHVIPYNVANYLFGLTRVSTIDVAVGTLLGNVPSAIFYTTLGADPTLLRQWRFTLSIAVINIGLLIPLVLRYIKPQWFRRVGIE